jgi:restriction system protein
MAYGGVDIRARVPGGASIIIQCKAYQQPVGPAAVRELYGTLLHEGAQEGWLVALAGFSGTAKQFAEGKPLRLIDVDVLISHSGRF